MNTLFLLSPPLVLPSSSRVDKFQPIHHCTSSNHHHGHRRRRRHSSLSLSHSFISHHHHPLYATPPSNSNEEGAVSVVNFEDLMEKDWSFLESDNTNCAAEEHDRKINRIISAGEIVESSRVLVSIGSEDFVDQLVEKSNCKLVIVVHDSLFVLAGIKEKHDNVKCWQGVLIDEPENWAPVDVVFLYFLPGLAFKLDQIFEALGKCCLTGARLIISHPQGREVVEQQRREHPDVVISELPDETTLQKVAADHSFEMAEYVDEPGFYLAILKVE